MSGLSSSGDIDDDEVRIMDHRGCLTLDAICFTDQLGPDHRAVVERHIRSCGVCAQQQTQLARATERMRGARPRVPVPAEIRILARQVALKGLALRARTARPSPVRQQRSTARIRALGRRRPPWYRSRTFWAAAIMGLAAAVVLVLLVLVLLQG